MDRFNKLFKDRCYIGVNGKPNRGPGLFCSIFLILAVIIQLIQVLVNFYLIIEHGKELPKLTLILQTIINVCITIFTIYYMYSACYMCSGIYGYIILAIILNILTFILNHTIYKTLIKDEKKIFRNVLLDYIGKHPKQFMNFVKKNLFNNKNIYYNINDKKFK